jgi:tRNA(Ile)-lysidine synthase
MPRSNRVKDLEKRFSRHLESLLCPPFRLMVAVSGGSDSMGLLHLAARAREPLGLEVSVGFVNHGLRAAAAGEGALVARAAAELGVPMATALVPPEEARAALAAGSLQSWARERRYRLLGDMARERGMTHLATAHTCDDQAETLLLRTLRGCGLDGLVGIHPALEMAGVLLIRPLLELRREELREYLEHLGVFWAEDPSNQNPRFLRTRVRAELLPLMNAIQPETTRRLAALARDVKAVVDFLEPEMLKGAPLLENIALNHGIKVGYEVFRRFPEGLWGRIIRQAVRAVKGDLQRLERVHVEPIAALVRERRTTGALPLPGAITAYVDRGNLYLFSTPLPPAPEGCGRPVVSGPGVWRVRFDPLGAAAEVTARDASTVGGMVLRARRPGDRLLGSKRKLKAVLSRARVPRIYRDFMPVLALEDQVIAAPMVVPCRMAGVDVSWALDEASPCRDLEMRV